MPVTPVFGVIEQTNKLQAELKRCASLLDEAFAGTAQPMLQLDAAGLILSVNAAAARAMGHAESEWVGKPLAMLLPPRSKPKLAVFLDACWAHPDRPHTLDVRIVHADRQQHAYTLIAQSETAFAGRGRLYVGFQPERTASEEGAAQEQEQSLPAGYPAPQPTIPLTRPVLYGDLAALPDRLNSTVQRCCALLGVSYHIWSARMANRPAEAVSSVPAALIIRLLDAFPFLAAPAYAPEDLLKALSRAYGRRFTKTEGALLLGRSVNAYSRWQSSAEPEDAVLNLIGFLCDMLESYPRRG